MVRRFCTRQGQPKTIRPDQPENEPSQPAGSQAVRLSSFFSYHTLSSLVLPPPSDAAHVQRRSVRGMTVSSSLTRQRQTRNADSSSKTTSRACETLDSSSSPHLRRIYGHYVTWNEPLSLPGYTCWSKPVMHIDDILPRLVINPRLDTHHRLHPFQPAFVAQLDREMTTFPTQKKGPPITAIIDLTC